MHNKARSSTYIIKEIEKLVLCVYGMIYTFSKSVFMCFLLGVQGVIMHMGNVERILEKNVKHEAYTSVFSQHFPALPSHLSCHKRTQLVFDFLNTVQ